MTGSSRPIVFRLPKARRSGDNDELRRNTEAAVLPPRLQGLREEGVMPQLSSARAISFRVSVCPNLGIGFTVGNSEGSGYSQKPRED